MPCYFGNLFASVTAHNYYDQLPVYSETEGESDRCGSRVVRTCEGGEREKWRKPGTGGQNCRKKMSRTEEELKKLGVEGPLPSSPAVV